MNRILLLLFCLTWSGIAQQLDENRVIQMAERAREVQQAELESQSRYFQKPGKTVLPDSADYDQLFYDLNFTITLSPQNFSGVVTGVFRSTVSNLNYINLNFDSREDYPPYWSNFSVSGNVSGYSHANWVLRVNLDRAYQPGETFSIIVHYTGIPRSTGLAGFWFSNGVFTLSEPYAAQSWWPCKDDPADKIDSVRITVTVPSNNIVASNGLLENKTIHSNHTTTYVWMERYPITTYLVSLAVDQYVTFQDSFQYAPGQFMPIEYYVKPHQYATAVAAFQSLPEMLAVYSSLFGLYPFITEKYGHAVFPWGGAMEHQTCTSIGPVGVNYETLYAHELAHQWFGNLVTCQNWHHIWMNEGFAVYCEALWMEARYGKQAFHTYVNNSLNSTNYNNYFVSPVYRYDTSNPHHIFSWTVYIKGMWVLHMLRHVVGDSVFFEIMHDYPNDPVFTFKNVTTEQFRDFCEMRSGMDLDWFFHQWVYQEYYPVYKWGYSHYQSAGQNFMQLVIQQQQDLQGYSHFYQMPLDIVIEYSNHGRDTVVVGNSSQTEVYHLPLTGVPVAVWLDPENWVLKKATQVPLSEILLPLDLAGTFHLYQNYPNPFNGTTRIPFALDSSGHVILEVYDLTGRRVRTLLEGYLTRGTIISWDGRDDRQQPVASGIYLCFLKFKGQLSSRKMVLLK